MKHFSGSRSVGQFLEPFSTNHDRPLWVAVDRQPGRTQGARDLPEKGVRLPASHLGQPSGGGKHWWFRLPAGVDLPPLRKGFLWKGDEGSHQGVERIADDGLLMSPPSIHPVTRASYQFAEPGLSPLKLVQPAVCPPWLLDWP